MARILIIDDDKALGMLKEMMELEGYEVVTASDGQKGMNLYRKEPADLVITDILMPNKDGLEVIEEMQEYFSDAKIIAVSGGGRIASENFLKTADMLPNVKRTFQKPVNFDDMLQAVKELLSEPR